MVFHRKHLNWSQIWLRTPRNGGNWHRNFKLPLIIYIICLRNIFNKRTSIKCEEMIATDIVISFVTHYTRTSIKCKIIAFTWYDHMERPLPPPNSEYTNQNSKFLCSTDRWVLYATVRLYIPAGKRLLLGWGRVKQKRMLNVRIELTTSRLWDWRSADWANRASNSCCHWWNYRKIKTK